MISPVASVITRCAVCDELHLCGFYDSHFLWNLCDECTAECAHLHLLFYERGMSEPDAQMVKRNP